MDRPFFIVNDNPAKLQHLCRMCAAPCNKAVPIFGPEGEENELAIKFNKYLPVKVFETDSIPLQLCYECTNLLMQWDAAILVAVAADKKLRALLWREQQSQEVNMKEKEETQQSVQIRKRKRSSARAQEALCCSVCNKKGMDFRELVEHLKTHKDPGAETESCSIQASGIGDANCSINDLLTPVVCLETLDLERQLRSKKSNSESQQEKTDSSNKFKKKGKRGKPKRVTRSTEQNSDVNDLLVTSSTSTPYNKPPETSEGDNTHSAPVNTANNFANPSSDAAATTGCNTKKELTPDNQNNTFKPKVRIISAESINQTLEERAKANQTAKSLESYQPDVLITGSSPLSGGPSPPKSPTKPPMRRLVLSGQVVNGINPDTAKPGQKFLKLSDGRIIKIIQNNPNSPVTLAPTGQRVQVLSRKVIGSNNEKPAFQLRPLSPDALKIAGSQAQKSDEAQPTLVRQMRRVGNKEFYFICQPGPRHCPNRYICAFCCKRNLTQESLQEHSELHVFPSDKSPLNQC